MRKIKKRSKYSSYYKKYPPAEIDVCDIEKIISYLHELPGKPSINISTTEYKEMSVEDLEKTYKGKIIREIEINFQTEKPYANCEIKIEKNAYTLYYMNEEPIYIGTLTKIKDLLESRKRKFYWTKHIHLVNLVLFGILYFCISIGVVIVGKYGISKEDILLVFYILIYIIGSLEVIYLLFIPFRRFVIHTTRIESRLSFWQENKDNIIVQVIVGVILLAAGILIGWLLS